MRNGKLRRRVAQSFIDTSPVVHQRRPWTHVRLAANVNGVTVYGDGFSKVKWPDKWSEQTGVDVAYAHALRDLARNMWNLAKRSQRVRAELIAESERIARGIPTGLDVSSQVVAGA